MNQLIKIKNYYKKGTLLRKVFLIFTIGKAILSVITLAIFINFKSFALNTEVKPDCEHTDTSFKCVKYLRNYDGDTVTFNIPNIHKLLGAKISIRLNGVDTPEIKGKTQCEKDKARQAQKLVKELLSKARVIHLKNIDRGKYFR